MRTVWMLLQKTFSEWQRDNVSRLAAALSYYTAVSAAPLLMVAVGVIGAVLGMEQAREELIAQSQQLVGEQGAQILETVINNADVLSMSSLTGLITAVALLWGATAVFNQLREALNVVWNVQVASGQGIVRTALDRASAFLVMALLGITLALSLTVNAALDVISSYMPDLLAGADTIWQTLDVVGFLVLLTLLFAAVFRILPDTHIAWRDVWLGAFATAALFIVGREVLGWYLRRQGVSSVYGAAGSLFVFLLWVYYSAQIFLAGAEFTKVYAEWRNGHLVGGEETAP